jgi:hypothetical protein
MPAYYGLKWCATNSINRGGFGENMDRPLATIVEGYSSIVHGLAGGPGVEVKLNTTVTAITRLFGTGAARISYQNTHNGEQGAQLCDIVVLSGNMAAYTNPNPATGTVLVFEPNLALEGWYWD